MGKWSLLSAGRGSRSCVLVALVICCVWRVKCWRIRELFDFRMFVSHGSHFFIIYLEIPRWEGGMTGRKSPGWGNSWFRAWVLWRLSRGGNRRDSLGEGGWSSTCTFPVLYNRTYWRGCRNPFLNGESVGLSKSQGHGLVDSGARVFVPLEIRNRPISGIEMPRRPIFIFIMNQQNER